MHTGLKLGTPRVIHASPNRLIGKAGANFPGGFFYPGEGVIVSAAGEMAA